MSVPHVVQRTLPAIKQTIACRIHAAPCSRAASNKVVSNVSRSRDDRRENFYPGDLLEKTFTYFLAYSMQLHL